MKNEEVVKFNKGAWDRIVKEGKNEWTIPVSHEEIIEAKKGIMKIYLTPTKIVPKEWFPDIVGKKVLCLASGGGQQGPILSAAGADVTVFDNSPNQLKSDEMVANREGLNIHTVQGDMKDLSVFDDSYFDLIIHPVSNLFVPDINPVWKEASRVLKKGGILLSGFVNPLVYIFDEMKLCKENKMVVTHKIPYSPFNDDAKEMTRLCMKYNEPLEYGHTLEDQIGGQTRAGFVISDLFEDRCRDESGSLLDKYIDYFMATRAIKVRDV